MAVFLATSVLVAGQDAAITRSLVKIYSRRAGEVGSSLGAGVRISTDGTILTAYHVIQGASTLEVYPTGSRSPVPVDLTGSDEWRDLATLRLRNNTLAITSEPLGTIPPNLGQRHARAYGHPDGKENFGVDVGFNKDGIILSKTYFGPNSLPLFAIDNLKLVAIDATIDRGMSGGPVILDGKVIGIISGSLAPQGRALGWAIPSEYATSLKPANGMSVAMLPPLRMLLPPVITSALPLLKKSGIGLERLGAIDRARAVIIDARAAYPKAVQDANTLQTDIAAAITLSQTATAQSPELSRVLATVKRCVDFSKELNERHLKAITTYNDAITIATNEYTTTDNLSKGVNQTFAKLTDQYGAITKARIAGTLAPEQALQQIAVLDDLRLLTTTVNQMLIAGFQNASTVFSSIAKQKIASVPETARFVAAANQLVNAATTNDLGAILAAARATLTTAAAEQQSILAAWATELQQSEKALTLATNLVDIYSSPATIEYLRQ